MSESMASRLSPELRAQLQRLSVGAQSEQRWPFLVTLHAGAQAAAVLPVAPEMEVPAINLACAALTAAQALLLAEHEAVQTIEPDGVAEAIAKAAVT